MCIKSGENLNDEVKQATETSVNANMSEQDLEAMAIISQLQIEQLLGCSIDIKAGTALYRLQPGSYGGISVYFSLSGKEHRYSLTDGINGSMYLAYDPKTALKEVFQKKKSLRESDLDNYYMGTVAIEKDVKILQVKQLVSKTRLTINHVTTARRAVTQLLAARARAVGFDGMEYLSNVTGEACLVLWHDNVAGTGMAVTHCQTCLSHFNYNGKDAADILVYDLNIPVEE